MRRLTFTEQHAKMEKKGCESMPYIVGEMVKAGPLYEEICGYLLRAADHGFNEHFHWARFEAMLHSEFCDGECLHKMALFRYGRQHRRHVRL